MSRRIEQVQKWWVAEASRRFLWLPIGFAAGIAAYFSLPVEPPLWLLSIVALATVLGVAFTKTASRLLWIAALLIALGALRAGISTHVSAHDVARIALEPRPMVGVVSDIERTEHGVRLTLNHLTIDGVSADKTPQKVRLSVRLKKGSDLALPHIGDAIQITAGLRPPMGPALPHGFDFARYFYFREIGAVGYGLPPWKVIGNDTPRTTAERFWDWRVQVTEGIISTLGKGTGGIAAGLITGDARAISEKDFEALRASNLYHIIAISGEHMVVIAGVIFIGLRLLALVILPRRLAYRPQVKSIAAALTLLLVTAYLFVTGLPISAVRAYVMIFLVLLAVMLRRHVDPMRALAITGMAMLLCDPSDLLEPGFQLSFAATLAIVALVETALLAPPKGAPEGKWSRKFRLLLTMLMVSVVAEAATAPFVIAMFNNVSLYGIFANMLATPLVSLFLMPTVALYFLLVPFGLQQAALWLMDVGIRGLLSLAHFVATLPHAQMFVPSIPGYGVALFALGLAWVCLWQTRSRRLGFIAMLLGMLTVTIPSPPDTLVGGELKQIVLSTPEGYVLARGRSGSMVVDLWTNGLGYAELPQADAPHWRCDGLGCVATVKHQKIAFPKNPAALLSDCTNAALLFTTYGGLGCAGGAKTIGAEALQGANVFAVWVERSGAVRVEKSADWQGNRPWSAVNVTNEDE